MPSNFQLIYIITFPSKNNSELAFLKSTVYYIRNCVDPRDAGVRRLCRAPCRLAVEREGSEMGHGHVTIFCGEGRGKTSAAIGQAILAAGYGRSVIVIQFLKGKTGERLDYIKRLEPEIELFRFEKSDREYGSLSPDEQREESMNIRNGMNFARKVLATGGCDMLILDEVLGLVDQGIVTLEELETLIEGCGEDMELVLTGIKMFDGLYPYVDDVIGISKLK